jgi:hypothetical protein
VGTFQEAKREGSELLGKRVVGQLAGEGKGTAVVVGAVTGPWARLSSKGVFKQPEGTRKLTQVV